MADTPSPSPRRQRTQVRQRNRVVVAAILAVLVVGVLVAIPLTSAGGTGEAPATARAQSEVIAQSAPDSSSAGEPAPAGALPDTCATDDMDCIENIIIIVQENRSFDHYFGTYESPSGTPVNGIPTKPDGSIDKQASCNPHPVLNKCLPPYYTKEDTNLGGPHGRKASIIAVNKGKMNGFIEAILTSPHGKRCVENPRLNSCKKFVGPGLQPDAMSFRKTEDIPNYHAYADWGVLQDRMFAPVDSYTLPAHMFLISAWAASCKSGPMSCKSDATPNGYRYPWTPITYLLDEQNVSWGYFVGDGTNVCMQWPNCKPIAPKDATPYNWNPPPGFTAIRERDGKLNSVRVVSEFEEGLETGDIPQVSWVIPGASESEHPGKGSMRPGYRYVTNLMNDIAESPVWDKTAIFLTWDDWGGFYDHVRPIRVDSLGYGIRVPAMALGPFARQGEVQKDTLSFDAYLKFIEDRFLGGERLDPETMSRPDSRPNVREEEPVLGDVSDAFDFTQPPRDPSGLILDPAN